MTSIRLSPLLSEKLILLFPKKATPPRSREFVHNRSLLPTGNCLPGENCREGCKGRLSVKVDDLEFTLMLVSPSPAVDEAGRISRTRIHSEPGASGKVLYSSDGIEETCVI